MPPRVSEYRYPSIMARPATPMVGRCMARRHGFALPRVARAGLDTASHCTIAPRLGAGRRRRRRASCDGTAERHDRIRPRARGNARRQTLQSRRPRALRYARARRRLVHPVQRAASGRPCRPSRGTGRAAAASRRGIGCDGARILRLRMSYDGRRPRVHELQFHRARLCAGDHRR